MDEAWDQKRGRILEIASGIIRKQGIRKTTLDDIAIAAGMATTSMYHYFANKNELLRGVVSTMVDRIIGDTEAAVAASGAPEDKLIATWKVLFSAVTNSGFLLNIHAELKPEVIALADDLIKEFDRRYRVLIRRVLCEGVDQGVFQIDDIELAVAVLSNGVIGLITTVAGQAEYQMLEGQIEKIGTLLMKGLRSR